MDFGIYSLVSKEQKEHWRGSPLSAFVTTMTKGPEDLDNTSGHMPGPLYS